MKVKELDVTANLSWSPAQLETTYLCTGTAAQQLDASFSTASSLDLYKLDLAESGHDMPKVGACNVDHRFQALVWGSCGMGTGGSRPSGVIAGGLDQGGLVLYDAAALLRGEDSKAPVFQSAKHTGSVQALDYNPFQSNLLASGAAESEIYIWDLNKLAGPNTTPMSPGAKSQPPDEVRCLAWNKQVQHILATTFASRCVVWDLRKNDPIIKVSDSTSRMRTKVVAWHPEVATQLCLASEDDHTPVIQIWDLRLASSPIRTLESHHRGVLSVAWCQQDPDLLLSCGKDNRILCWNPNTGEVQCELASSSSWSFDVHWCPRNPAVLASASFDGHVSVYSLLGGQQQAQPSSSIADSFPGMEAMKPVTAAPAAVPMQLKNPPKWLKRPCGASFGFGGKLVAFEGLPQVQQAGEQARITSKLSILNVVTEPELVERSMRLETSIQNQNLAEFCQAKVSGASKKDEQDIWRFIGANYSSNPRLEFLSLLGFKPDQVAENITSVSGVKVPDPSTSAETDQLAQDLESLNTTEDKLGAFDAIAAASSATEDQGPEVAQASGPLVIQTDDSDSGLLTQALLTGNLELAVELCLKFNRMADALILATQGTPELVERTKQCYFRTCNSSVSQLIETVTTGSWRQLISKVSPENWKEALVAAVTYASNEEYSIICSELGDRLVGRNPAYQAAMICYICAGDVNKLVDCWMTCKPKDMGPKALQDLVEVAMSLKQAVEQLYGGDNAALRPGGMLAAKLSQYANLLAAQGALAAALSYLGNGEEEETINQLRNRLSGALGYADNSRRTRLTSTSSIGKHGQASRRRSSNLQPNFGASTGSYVSPPQPTAAAAPTSFYNPNNYANTAAPGPMDSLGLSGPPPTSFAAPGLPPASSAAPTSFMTPAAPLAAPPPAVASYGKVEPPPAHLPPTSSGPGWNDPPPSVINSMPKPSSKTIRKVEISLPPSGITQPITAPLGVAPDTTAPPSFAPPGPIGMDPYSSAGGSYGSPPSGMFDPSPMTSNPVSAPGYGGQMGYAPPPANFMVPGQSTGQPYSQTHEPPANFMTPAAPTSAIPAAPAPREPEPPKEKGPIPAEHQALQNVFDGLRAKCLLAANHPQTRRKLDDVGKKLEVLYDRLREQSLPQATLNGLHQERLSRSMKEPYMNLEHDFWTFF